MQLKTYQLRDIIASHIKRENGLNEVLEATLNAMMKVERREQLHGQLDNKANGYRQARAYGHGKILELTIPRDRNGEFYPKVLTLLREQQAETDRLVSALYAQGLTQRQVGEVFSQLYGRHYSPSAIGRMIEWMHREVDEWLSRPLEAYYPIVFVDAIHVKVRRETVSTEAFYVVLGVTEQRTREVLAIAHMPSESATGWQSVAEQLQDRGVQQIGLVVADGLKGLSQAFSQVFGTTRFQRCTTHVKRHLLAQVRASHKTELAEDLRQVFRTDDRNDTPEAGWQRWQDMCRKWSKRYRRFARLETDPEYEPCFTYLQFDHRIRSMIYTTNWIERLNRDFRRVLKMRGAMPDEQSVITLIGHVALDKKAWNRKLPKMDHEKSLFSAPISEGDPPPG